MAWIYQLLVTFGVDPIKMFNALRGLPHYLKNFQVIHKQSKVSKKRFHIGKIYPCPGDRFGESGSAKGHYFHQDLLVARRVNANAPNVHVDVGSRIDGFVAHLAAFRKVKVLDIRPLSSCIPNVEFIQADLMENIGEALVDHCDSLSCLHALEHFGLGRYGDRINYDGYLLGLENLYRILRKNGKLYLSVPIGPQRIEFDAHRVFSLSYLLELLEGKYRIDNFSFVDDEGRLHENVKLSEVNMQNNYMCQYGCGILEMTKL